MPEITATLQPAETHPSATADPDRVPTKDGVVCYVVTSLIYVPE